MIQEIEKLPISVRLGFAKALLGYAKATEEVTEHEKGRARPMADADAALQAFRDGMADTPLAALMERYEAESKRVAAEQTAHSRAAEELEKLKERWTRWHEEQKDPHILVGSMRSKPQDPATFEIPEVQPMEAGLEEGLIVALDKARDLGRDLDNALAALDAWQNKADELHRANVAAKENLHNWRMAFDAGEAREADTRRMRENQIAAQKAAAIKWAEEQRAHISKTLKECGVEE